METETIKVTKCGECPWWRFNNGCSKGLFDNVSPLAPPPLECPLKGKTIKIEVE